MLGPNWRDSEFDSVEELSAELRDMIAALGQVRSAHVMRKRRAPGAAEETEVYGFTL
jgi:hypothetical protein